MNRNLVKLAGAATLILGFSGIGIGVNEIFNLSAAEGPPQKTAEHCQAKTWRGQNCLDREQKAELAVQVAGGGVAACAIGLLLLGGPGRKRPQQPSA